MYVVIHSWKIVYLVQLVSLKNNDIDEYMNIQNNEYSGHRIGFDRKGKFLFGQNLVETV